MELCGQPVYKVGCLVTRERYHLMLQVVLVFFHVLLKVDVNVPVVHTSPEVQCYTGHACNCHKIRRL